MRVMKHTILAASLIGGAAVLSGGSPASAATLSAAFEQTPETAAIQEVRHRWVHRSGRLAGELYWRPKNSPNNYDPWSFRRYGPAVGFGLSVPGFSFGIGVPSRRYYAYDYDWPYGYGYRGYW